MPAEEPRFLLDNTAISNFSAVGRMDVLRERYGGRLMVTLQVPPVVLLTGKGGNVILMAE